MAQSVHSPSLARRQHSVRSALTLFIVFVTAMALSAVIGVGALLAAAWGQSGLLLGVASEWGIRAVVSLLVGWAAVLAGTVLLFIQDWHIERKEIS